MDDAVRMRRDLAEPFPAATWPPGVRVRTWRDDDAPRVHALLVEGYRRGGGDVPAFDEWRDALVSDAEFDAACVLLAEDASGDVVGVAICWTSAFVKDLVVAERARRRGLGAGLVCGALALFASRGAAAVELKVRRDNPSGARRLYERAGFRAVP